MLDVYIGIGIFVMIYLAYLLVIMSNKKRLTKYINKSRETVMVKAKYDLNYDKINHKLVANLFGLANGFIIGGTYILMTYVGNVIIKFLVALLVMVIVVFIVYAMIGKYLKKKEM